MAPIDFGRRVSDADKEVKRTSIHIDWLDKSQRRETVVIYI